MEWNKAITSELIEMYSPRECLWKIGSKLKCTKIKPYKYCVSCISRILIYKTFYYV